MQCANSNCQHSAADHARPSGICMVHRCLCYQFAQERPARSFPPDLGKPAKPSGGSCKNKTGDGRPGIGGAPTRATTLPGDPAERKKYPIASGVLDYFPDALAALAHLSWKGNEQHNPGQPLHWDRSKSSDEADTMLRHFLQRGTFDTDGIRHSVKAAWRALALLQKEIEAEQENK